MDGACWPSTWPEIRFETMQNDRLFSSGSQSGGGQSESATQNTPAVSSQLLLPHPSLAIPSPNLAFEFRMAAKLRGNICRVRLRNEGVRDLNVVDGGEWVASFGRGTIRVGCLASEGKHTRDMLIASSLVATIFKLPNHLRKRGQEWTRRLSWRPTTSHPPRTFSLHAAALTGSATDEGRLEMRTRGYIAYEPGSLAKIAAGAEDDERYAFRMVMTLRTEDERYAERVNLGLWLGCGVLKEGELVLE